MLYEVITLRQAWADLPPVVRIAGEELMSLGSPTGNYEALRIVKGVADALAFAHRKGIIV